ncbi:MAG: hypothetical protein ACYC22_14345 [Thiomonas delicata]
MLTPASVFLAWDSETSGEASILPVVLQPGDGAAAVHGVLLGKNRHGDVTIMASTILQLGAVYHLERPGVAGSAGWVVESCRSGGRSGDAQLGRFISVLRPVEGREF